MLDDDKLYQYQVAEMMGVHKTEFGRLRVFLPAFPAMKKIGKTRFFRKADIMAWMQANDFRALIKQARSLEHARTRRPQVGRNQPLSPETEAAIARSLALSRRWLAGEFATAEQKQAHALRKRAAKTVPPQTHTVRVAAQWYRD